MRTRFARWAFTAAAFCALFPCFSTLWAQVTLGGEICRAGKHTALAMPYATDPRSDSVDILHYDLDLRIPNLNTPWIGGACTVRLVPRLPGVQHLRLDLEGLSVDSVKAGAAHLSYEHLGPALHLQLPAPLGPADTLSVTVWYGGQPLVDASGWGGFYFNTGHAFNLGVGFAADPHNYGRVWHPCFDNFTERATYSFRVTTPVGRPAFCNGYLVGESVNGTQLTRLWRLDEPIPTYLACVAAADYAVVRQQFPLEAGGTVPVELVARPADTTDLKNSFARLSDAVACFEHWYGPYRWNKVGYSIVPFNSGAMEHATNIAYPGFAVDGSLGYEDLMAHELSHHWWGDLATCTTAEDMWLNEGIASYSEHLFAGWTGGPEAYREAVISNHLSTLGGAHLDEGGYRAVSGVPHQYTYGRHVYNKGASVMHNLRGYLGDSLLRAGLRQALDQAAFDDHSSADFRDRLSAATGRDMTAFFDDWVFAPGYADYLVDSVRTVPTGGLFQTTVRVRQKRLATTHFHTGVPLDVTFIGPNHQRTVRRAEFSGELSDATFALPFAPRWVLVNAEHQMCLAQSFHELRFAATGPQILQRAKMNLNVTALPDTAWLRATHHYTAPDDAQAAANGWRLSGTRFWEVHADLPTGTQIRGVFAYNGNPALAYNDNDLLFVNDDSLALLWRPGPQSPWQEYPSYSRVVQGPQSGLIVANDLREGQYVLANIDRLTGLDPAPRRDRTHRILVRPNPTDRSAEVYSEQGQSFDRVQISTMGGLPVLTFRQPSAPRASLWVDELAPGTYLVTVWGDGWHSTAKMTKTR
jgi:aminopeptidase N